MKDQLILKEQIPTEKEFITIRDLVGWGKADKEATIISLNRGLYTVCLRKNGELVGLGRVVGDGGLYFYITIAWAEVGANPRDIEEKTEEGRGHADSSDWIDWIAVCAA